MKIAIRDKESLKRAKELLEAPSLAIKISDKFGNIFETGLAALPANWNVKVQLAVTKSIDTACEIVVKTFKKQPRGPSYEKLHKLAATLTGAGGGAFGLVALPLELPISTCIMLRSILDIARNEGQDISSLATRLESLHVFALGGSTKDDDSADTGYFAVRAALSKYIQTAVELVGQKMLYRGASGPISRFTTQIGSRFGVVVSKKTIAQAAPVIGAISGAVINNLFIDHYQQMARGHFTVLRLEKKYGKELIKDIYGQL